MKETFYNNINDNPDVPHWIPPYHPTGNLFPFLKLLGEIRNQIYCYLLPNVVETDGSSGSQGLLGEENDRDGEWRPYLEKPSAIMDVNQQLRGEFLSLITFDFSITYITSMQFLLREVVEHPRQHWLFKIRKIRYD